MKTFLVFLAALFSLPILLIAGFLFIRLVAIELAELIKEAWRSPETGSAN